MRNFVQLCLEGYYDGTIFHRIIKDFMAQGGDPTGTGTGAGRGGPLAPPPPLFFVVHRLCVAARRRAFLFAGDDTPQP